MSGIRNPCKELLVRIRIVHAEPEPGMLNQYESETFPIRVAQTVYNQPLTGHLLKML
jgi:hypothetical protein